MNTLASVWKSKLRIRIKKDRRTNFAQMFTHIRSCWFSKRAIKEARKLRKLCLKLHRELHRDQLEENMVLRQVTYSYLTYKFWFGDHRRAYSFFQCSPDFCFCLYLYLDKNVRRSQEQDSFSISSIKIRQSRLRQIANSSESHNRGRSLLLSTPISTV